MLCYDQVEHLKMDNLNDDLCAFVFWFNRNESIDQPICLLAAALKIYFFAHIAYCINAVFALHLSISRPN